MKTKQEILEYYGRCCVSEFLLSKETPSDKRGEAMEQKDAAKLQNIKGQKMAIEFIFKEVKP